MPKETPRRRRFGHCLKCGSEMRVKTVRPQREFVIVRYRRGRQCGHRRSKSANRMSGVLKKFRNRQPRMAKNALNWPSDEPLGPWTDKAILPALAEKRF